MNRTKIDWVRNPDGSPGYTWNPMTGCYGPRGKVCAYCYAARIAKRFDGTPAFPHGFEPTFHPERLSEPDRLRVPRRIFVGSMTDLFGDWVTLEQFAAIWRAMLLAPWHTYYLLTKQAENVARKLEYTESIYPGWRDRIGIWIGATCTDMAIADRQEPHMRALRWPRKFISIEPLLGDIPDDLYAWAGWVIVGAMTGPGAQSHRPRASSIRRILDACNARDMPVFLKDNLAWTPPRQEWPE